MTTDPVTSPAAPADRQVVSPLKRGTRCSWSASIGPRNATP